MLSKPFFFCLVGRYFSPVPLWKGKIFLYLLCHVGRLQETESRQPKSLQEGGWRTLFPQGARLGARRFPTPASVFQEKGVGTMRILESPECQTDSVEGGQARTFFQYPPNGGWPSEKGKGTRSSERPLQAGCGLGSPAVTVHPPICFKISLLFFASVAPQQFGDHVTDDRENGSPPGEARRPEGLP